MVLVKIIFRLVLVVIFFIIINFFDALENLGLKVVFYVASYHTPAVLTTMKIISALGGEGIFFALIPLLTWSNQPKCHYIGMWLALLMAEGFFFEATAKLVFARDRPWHPELEKHDDAEKGEVYSFPSGHAFAATIGWLFLAKVIKKPFFLIVAILIIALTGFSRVYLSVHYPHDIVGGIILGLFFLEFWLYCLHPKTYNYESNELKTDGKLIYFHLTFLILMMVLNILLEEQTKDIPAVGFHMGPTITGTILYCAYFSNHEWDGGKSLGNVFLRIAIGLPLIGIIYFINKTVYYDGSTGVSLALVSHASIILGILWIWSSSHIFSKVGLANFSTKK